MSMPSLEPEETPLPRTSWVACAGIVNHGSRRGIGTGGERPTAAIEVPRIALAPAGDGWSLVAVVPFDGQRAAGRRERRPGAGRSGVRSRHSGIRRSWRVRPDFPASSRSIRRRPPDRERSECSPRGRRPAPFGLPDPGRRRQDGPARVRHRPRRSDPAKFRAGSEPTGPSRRSKTKA